MQQNANDCRELVRHLAPPATLLPEVQTRLATTPHIETRHIGTLPHFGYDHNNEGGICRAALGMIRIHIHGQSEAASAMSADPSGPHPEAVGYHHLFHVGRCMLPRTETAMPSGC